MNMGNLLLFISLLSIDVINGPTKKAVSVAVAIQRKTGFRSA
jgi:hypothetical protein